MNHSLNIFLVNSATRMVSAAYEVDTEREKAKRTNFKTLDQSIKVNDLCVVPTQTRHRMTVVRITEIDIPVDFDSTDNVDWIVGSVDRSQYEILLAEEGRMLKMVRDAEETHRREELRQKLMAHVDSNQLGALKITKMGESKPEPRGGFTTTASLNDLGSNGFYKSGG